MQPPPPRTLPDSDTAPEQAVNGHGILPNSIWERRMESSQGRVAIICWLNERRKEGKAEAEAGRGISVMKAECIA